MNVEEDFFDLSCNTNTIYNIERNKFVLINAIIEESIKSTTDQPKFNISDRTKLVLMDEEELNEIHDFFKTTEDFSFDEARQEFDEEEFNDDEIRILRIDFISKVGN